MSAPLTEPQPLSAWVVFGTALASSLLLYLCYFPVAWGFLGWIALAPFLLLVRARVGNRARYWTALAVGLLFYVPVLQWMRVADSMMYVTWLALAACCSLFYPLGLFWIRFLDRKTPLPLVLSVPVVWTALEFFRSTFCGGFSWYQLGHSQHDYLPVIQIADITGAYGVSFLLAAFNALLVEGVFGLGWLPRLFGTLNKCGRYSSRSLGVQALGVAMAVVVTLGYGWWQLRDDTYRAGPRVALIQGNLDQRIRNNSQQEGVGLQVLQHYESLAKIAGERKYHPDLIVWPETSYPYPWLIDSDGDLAVDNAKHARQFVLEATTNHLIGVDIFQEQPDHIQVRRYNSAILLTPEGDWVGRYDKMHRVPFGEYVPLKDTIPLMKKLAPYDFDYSIEPGQHHTQFAMTEPNGEHRHFTFGTIICYEDTDPEVARPYGGGDGQAPTDFLVNISNDGWFNGTSEHEEHLAVCRFRAIECRRSVLRSVNMGISAVIDADGRVLQPQSFGVARPTNGVQMREQDLPRLWDVSPRDGKRVGLPLSQWREYKKVQGVMLATVPLDHRTSFYARWGDWLPWLCWLLLLPVVAITCWQMVTAMGRPLRRLVGGERTAIPH